MTEINCEQVIVPRLSRTIQAPLWREATSDSTVLPDFFPSWRKRLSIADDGVATFHRQLDRDGPWPLVARRGDTRRA